MHNNTNIMIFDKLSFSKYLRLNCAIYKIIIELIYNFMVNQIISKSLVVHHKKVIFDTRANNS